MLEVQLFNTCLAEQFFPAAIEATVKVLEALKLKVRPMRRAFCCGQAPFNEGLRAEALGLARNFLGAALPGMPIVVPSGSCAAMIRNFYRDLLADEPASLKQAAALQPWVFELGQFIVNVMKVKYLGARFDHTVAYHPSCHLARELRAADDTRVLLANVNGLKLVDFRNPEECCGFGGMFAVKFPALSTAMAQDKLERIRESAAELLVANDCGCLMQLGGLSHRNHLGLEVRHVAEVLAAR
ncbi:MAG TPA: (Fe-S)-binding protein [Candidatus Binataceae bacterium]|nr:(Fe-S)-binding protein [Candidatus Binataceae bacterium]